MGRQDSEYRPNGEDVTNYCVMAIPDIPEIRKGNNLARIIYNKSKLIGGLIDNDILVVASKIVSKAEGRVIDISSIIPSSHAIELSKVSGKNDAVCQVILNESVSYELHGHVIIARHKLGYILTSAGVDKVDDKHVSIIPVNPDSSSRKIRQNLEKLTGKDLTVVVSDSEGREDRHGAGAVALGVSGIDPLRRSVSPLGKQQEETISDMLANAASILIGQRGRNTPVVVIRGLDLGRNTGVGMQTYIK
jgi:coenzyme F420-0:L-glutamate ligase/coenzyme F420-1:gamma-L-glutamate ligase